LLVRPVLPFLRFRKPVPVADGGFLCHCRKTLPSHSGLSY
jgi:hypothetical protein